MADTVEGAARQRGLWREEFEHDACGIGALASIKGVRTHQMLGDALSVLLNMDHRGGTGLERTTGDGAGILFQVPHRFFRKEAQKCGQPAARRGELRRRHAVPAARRGTLRAGPRARRAVLHRMRHARAVLARGARRRARPGRHRARLPAAHLAGVRAQARPGGTRPGVRARPLPVPALHGEAGGRPRPSRARRVLHLLDERAHDRLQGHVAGGAATRVLPRPLRRDRRNRRGPGTLALLHQHDAELGTRPSQPPARAQRRDQHATRQPQLDPRPRAGAVLPRHRRPGAGAPHRRPRGQRLGDPGQRGGVPLHERAQHAPCDEHAFARALGQQRAPSPSGAGRSTPTSPPSWSPGTDRPPSPSPTACAPAPCSTATGCARRATR